MRSLKFVILLWAVVILWLLLFSYYAIPKKVSGLAMDMAVKPKTLGLNADTDALHFGIIPPGNSGFRKIVVNSKEHYRIVVEASDKELVDWMTVSENNFIMEPGTTKELEVTIDVPKNATEGNYTGDLIISFYRPLPWEG